MPHRTLASLAYALGGATGLDAALSALAGTVRERDPSARVALLSLDARGDMLTGVSRPEGTRVHRETLEVALDHLPSPVAESVRTGGPFTSLGDDASAYARLLGLGPLPTGGRAALRGLRFDGHPAAVLALVEAGPAFEVSTAEIAEPIAALFELCFVRFAEQEARREAVRTLEETTHRVHAEYETRLDALARQLEAHRDEAAAALADEQADARHAEEARRATQRLRAVEVQVMAAVAQLEQAHLDLHRLDEALRLRTRTLFLLERALALAAVTGDPRRLAEGLLELVGDDRQALSGSLVLCAPDAPDTLFLAAVRGPRPPARLGSRLRVGEGIVGGVAATRKPVIAADPADGEGPPLPGAGDHPAGALLCFPLELRGTLVGAVTVTNRVDGGVFVAEDVERCRLLALVVALVASESRLSERLCELLDAR